MTTATDTASPPDAGAHLATLPTLLNLQSEPEARSVLHCTSADLSARISDATLDVLVLAGHRWFRRDQVRALLITGAEARAAEDAERAARAAVVLRDYLASVEATGDYDIARDELRPLVCARVGTGWVNHGLRYHAVVVPLAGLSRFGPATADPGVRMLPGVGASLVDLFETVPGVGVQYSVTPLHGERRSRRVRNWVRVDTDQWTVRVPDEIIREIEQR